MKDQETLLPRFQRNIVVHTPYDGLREVLKEMHKSDYSQVLVRVQGRLRFITRDGLGCVMAEAWNDDYVDIKHRGIEDILAYEPAGTMAMMAGNRTVAEAADVLMELTTPRVFAVVVTDSGDTRGQPLGIVTPDDLRRPPTAKGWLIR